MRAEGTGTLYLADAQKKVQILELAADDRITVNGEDVLAFESELSYEVTTMDSLAGSFAGGSRTSRSAAPAVLRSPPTAIRWW